MKASYFESGQLPRTVPLSGRCPRCVMTTLPQGDLPKDSGILRTAAQHNQASVGVYADVLVQVVRTSHHPSHVADATRLPLATGSADCAVAFMSLHDIDHMPAAVYDAEAQRPQVAAWTCSVRAFNCSARTWICSVRSVFFCSNSV